MPPRVARAAVLRPDGGAGAVLLLGATAATILATLALLASLGLLVANRQVQGAADAAALAAADVASGAAPGAICDTAVRVAQLDHSAVVSCTVDGEIVTIEASGRWAGVELRARARAGPPP